MGIPDDKVPERICDIAHFSAVKGDSFIRNKASWNGLFRQISSRDCARVQDSAITCGGNITQHC